MAFSLILYCLHRNELPRAQILVVSKQQSLLKIFLTTRMIPKAIMILSAYGGKQMLGKISPFQTPQIPDFSLIVKLLLYCFSICPISKISCCLSVIRSSKGDSVTWNRISGMHLTVKP